MVSLGFRKCHFVYIPEEGAYTRTAVWQGKFFDSVKKQPQKIFV